jgi:hypothetical protein
MYDSASLILLHLLPLKGLTGAPLVASAVVIGGSGPIAALIVRCVLFTSITLVLICYLCVDKYAHGVD